MLVLIWLINFSFILLSSFSLIKLIKNNKIKVGMSKKISEFNFNI